MILQRSDSGRFGGNSRFSDDSRFVGNSDDSHEERLVIVGGTRLSGSVTVSGSKNAALAILAGALLAGKGMTTLRNLPRISDIATMADVLRHFGSRVRFEDEGCTAIIDATSLQTHEAPSELMNRMRASFWALGPVLARLGRAHIPQPGGCDIGARPIDLHIKGLQGLGAKISLGFGFVAAESPAEGLTGGSIYLDFPSVGATMNIMMAASLTPGKTIIENAAQEPDVEDLGDFLVAMGANIKGQGTSLVTIEGVEVLTGCDYSVIPDRIEAGTLGLAAGITGGDILLVGANSAHLRPVTLKMIEAGMFVEETSAGLRCVGTQARPRPTNLTALPHPGFPTDMQQSFTSLLSLADGTSVVTDKVYESRFRYLTEMAKLGVVSQVDGRTAVITGVPRLTGADVRCSDLRAGAALFLAGLVAEGQTRIYELRHMDRGYEDLVGKLAGVGANLWRENGQGQAVSGRKLTLCA